MNPAPAICNAVPRRRGLCKPGPLSYPWRMNPLTPIQARVLACLMEKEATTPDLYPLTLNALRNACNQKSSRDPVVAYTEGEVGHAVRQLEALHLVREEWGARTPKYRHQAGKALELHSKGIALLATLMLRGPQTAGELKSRCQRMFDFDDLDDVQYALGKLETREPPLVQALPRQPGQKEGRYAHLLCGEPEIPTVVARPAPARPGHDDNLPSLEARIERLEAEVERLAALLEDR